MIKQIRRAKFGKTYYKRVAAVFSLDEREMHAQMVRLVVLFEDLKIELKAASRKRTFLDAAGMNFRQFYFFRATLQTLR